jgi:thiol:disulfide interchange protein
MKNLLTLLLFLLCGQFQIMAQIENPVSWSYEYKMVSDTEVDLIFKADIEPGWKTYSPFQEYDEDAIAPVPIGIYFDEGSHFSTSGALKESGNRKVAKEPLFDNLNVAYFTKHATFTQRVSISDFSTPITGYLEAMACDAEKCLPPSSDDFSFTIAAPAPASKQEKAPAQPEKTKEEQQPSPAADGNAATTDETETEETEEIAPILLPAEPSDGMQSPVSWSFASKEIADGVFELSLTATIDEAWTIYSQHTDPDDGPLPTAFFFDTHDGYELLGEVEEKSATKAAPDPLFDGATVVKFTETPVLFVQQVKVKDPQQAIKGYLTYMACDDKQCLPPSDVEFVFNLSTGEAGTSAVVPDGLKGIDQTVDAIRATYVTPVGECGKEDVARDAGLLWTFVLGFAGGLLALLTPCVFPMIPLTVSFFTKSSKDRKTGMRNALLYGLSIIVIYVSIGLIITGVFGATALQALSTNWIANTLFFIIFVFFAFSFFGYYEITLPSSWANKSDSMADQGGLLGIFFMAFTLAIVSFSCTGPIIGSALVQSATNTLGPFVVMLGFSTALALPFALFAAFPGWLNSLPKSGGWMNSVKVVLGFLELALALKFLSVADMTMHWNILPYEVFMAAWIIIFGAMAAYLFGVIRFPHDGPAKSRSFFRMSTAVLTLAFTIYLITGFAYNDKTQSYNSLGVMSGLAPPAKYNLFLPEPKIDESLKGKYPSYTKCANNLNCFKKYEEGLAYARETGKPILLDFTGYGCVNCRKTEEHIWVDDNVWQTINQEFVLVSLYTDDRKKLEETLFSIPRQEKLRNVGNLWADFQIVNFEQNSQPLYIMMSPDEKVLAAPRGYKEGVKPYADFLNCGLQTYKQAGYKEAVPASKDMLGAR